MGGPGRHTLKRSTPTPYSETSQLIARKTIRLGPEDLNVNNSSLNEFINYAKTVVEQDEPERAARYGGILYLGLISAFEAAGMIRLKWAPALTLEVQAVDYEVSNADGHQSGMADLDISLIPPILVFARCGRCRRSSPC